MAKGDEKRYQDLILERNREIDELKAQKEDLLNQMRWMNLQLDTCRTALSMKMEPINWERYKQEVHPLTGRLG